MNLGTLILFLCGDRRAIGTVAANKHGLLVGLLFVLSAGLAREYDGADLWHEPWHLAIPLGASLLSSLALFLVVELVSWKAGGLNDQWLSRYAAFLRVFWMTAPLAWLYAIPFERFLSPADAVRANLSLLGLVALWRVLLMTRAISVLYRTPFIAAFPVVMLFADTIVLVVLAVTPLPVFGIMGGIRHTEDEMVLHSVAFIVRLFGILSWPLWLIGALIVAFRLRWSIDSTKVVPPPGMHWSTWTLAGLSVLIWSAVLPFTQPEQWNRRQVERLLRGGDISAGLQYLSERERTDFPPHWDVPPRIGYGERQPDLMQIIETARNENSAPWVQRIFIDKLGLQTSEEDEYFASPTLQIHEMSDSELSAAIETLSDISEGPAIAASRRQAVKLELERKQNLSLERRGLLEKFLRLADQTESGDSYPDK